MNTPSGMKDEENQKRVYAKLKSIWSEALEKPISDEHATFFDNGGDSMGVTSVLINIKDEFQVDISLETFFEDPTLQGLLETIVKRSTNLSA